MRLITYFQLGLPRDIILLWRAHPYDLDPPGLLPQLAVRSNNIPMLARLYRYHNEHQHGNHGDVEEIVEMSFDDLWCVALESRHVAVAEWIDDRAPELSHHDKDDDVTIRKFLTAATWLGDDLEMIKWLLTKRPHYKSRGHFFDMDRIATFAKADMFQWLEENVHSGLTCTTNAMDVAAFNGHLEMVKYLHATRTEGCTHDAMDYAAHNAHLDVVQFLHDHRPEGCTTQAMDHAAGNGHFQVVQFLQENRTEGAT